MSAIAKQLEKIVGAEAICAWESLEATLQSQISQAIALDDPPHLLCVVFPTTQDQLAAVMACAHTHHWRVLVCGSGSKLHWGGVTTGIQLVVSTARLDRLVEHAIGDLTVTAEAGMKLADLQAILGKAGQFLAIDSLYPQQATLGGVVATADTGALRQQYGGIRDMLIGLSFVRADGKATRAGGRVVKNVAGYDLMKLMTGSYGTLGIISQVTFRIYPVPPDSRTVVLTGDPKQIAQATATVIASALRPAAAELIASPTTTALNLGTGMGLIVRFQSMEVSVEKQADQLLKLGQVFGLQTLCLQQSEEADLWQRLREQIELSPQEPIITCKIGVLPSQAVETLEQLNQLLPSLEGAVVHAGSGLGIVRFPIVPVSLLTQLRDRCQAQGGFLTVLEAPPELKQTYDVWGYPGSGLALMKGIKQQFDPNNLLSPGRFVGGI
ncbi:MAG: FAD-binding oxidoreductase [Elainellaceae cyanobacterium]